MKRIPQGFEGRLAQENGQTGIVSFHEGEPFSMTNVVVDGDKVQAIHIVLNPAKLHVWRLTTPAVDK